MIASIGNQPSMFDVGDEKIAVFEDGSFIGVEKLRKIMPEYHTDEVSV